MKKIKVGVVGVGYMGVNHLRVYAKIPNIELVGFFDSRNLDIKKDFDIKSFSSLDEMSKKVDAVSIATPAKTHYRICSFFLKKKIHCLVEKPIATSEKDCKELISLSKKNKLVLLVGHIERFNPVITKLKSIIDKFKVRIINIERLSFVNTRNQDIDTVQDLMIHDIDLLNFLIKSKIHRIETMGFISKKIAPEYACALIKFKNKILGQLSSSRITKNSVRRMQITCENAFINVDFVNQSMNIIHRLNPIKKKDAYGNYDVDFYTEQLFIKKEEPLYLEISHFLDVIQKKKNLIIKPSEALESMKVAWKIKKKIRSYE